LRYSLVTHNNLKKLKKLIDLCVGHRIYTLFKLKETPNIIKEQTMKTLTLSVILATSVVMGTAYAAPSNNNELYGIDTTESNYMEDYAFENKIPMTGERVNFSASTNTQVKSNQIYDTNTTESNYSEAYDFGTETSTSSERVNFSASPTSKSENADIWNNFLANDEFDF
jgi:hypothetical protein